MNMEHTRKYQKENAGGRHHKHGLSRMAASLYRKLQQSNGKEYINTSYLFILVCIVNKNRKIEKI